VAAGRDDQALQGWGLLLGKGQGGPRNHSLGAALMQLGGADADEDPKGYGLALQRLTPSLQQEQARQHEVLQAAADLLAAVDTEIALQETLLQDALRDITNPRLRKQAALVLIRIANNGHAAAAYRLSLEVAFGKSIAGAQDDADHWLRLAARWGDPAAQVSLARQLMKGLNPALDEAEKWLLQAQASGVRGQESLLADLRTKRDELAALPGRAESGEAAAQRQLAQQLMDPTDPTDPQRVAQGMAWLQRAAEQGDAAAAAELGHALAFGRPGVAPDPLAARPWLDQAVQGGSAHGQAALAQLLAVPGATQSDAARALELAIESAANRSGNGLFLLATFLHAGVGGSRDVVAAKAVMHLAQVVGGELVRQHPDIWPQYQPTPDEHLPVQILRNQINDNLRGMPELLARRGETPAASG
jgi:TPR repeat protein